MGIFGWSLPPGCSTLPGEEDEEYCVICGQYPNDCTCNECTALVDCGDGINKIECGAIGCIEHLPSWELSDIICNLEDRLFELSKEAKKRERYTSPCPKCLKNQLITIFDDYDKECCSYIWDGREWRNRQEVYLA